MPRLATVMPEALAATVISNDTLVPSANEVTMCGCWPHCFAKPAWVVGLR